jgi:hypothetical protein
MNEDDAPWSDDDDVDDEQSAFDLLELEDKQCSECGEVFTEKDHVLFMHMLATFVPPKSMLSLFSDDGVALHKECAAGFISNLFDTTEQGAETSNTVDNKVASTVDDYLQDLEEFEDGLQLLTDELKDLDDDAPAE